MSPHQVVILHNEPVLPAHHPDAVSENEVLETVAAVDNALRGAGFEVGRLGVGRDPRLLLDGLTSLKPAVVFNLFEGLADQGETEAHVAGLLDWLAIPYTGSSFQTLCLARSKHLSKHLFHGAGLPTPRFSVVECLPIPPWRLEWPVIVKPAQHDGSVGLDQGSVVTDQAQLDRRVLSLLGRYGPPVLLEEFIHGRELNVSLIELGDREELRVLPVSEVLFLDKDPSYWPIVTYDAKWKPGSLEFEGTPARCPADVSPQLTEQLGTLARSAFRLLGCRDYARVDFRLFSSGTPYLLEVNPNPDLHPTAGLARTVRSAGLTYEQFVVDLVRHALARPRKPK
jgi:D-alanine-D-alanine ligase